MENTHIQFALVVLFLYVALNIFVTRRINAAYYLREEMKSLHKKISWFLPFIGPFMIRNFWKKPKSTPPIINTKTQRDKNTQQGGFYESGNGLDA